jgi:hypothetical protein
MASQARVDISIAGIARPRSRSLKPLRDLQTSRRQGSTYRITVSTSWPSRRPLAVVQLFDFFYREEGRELGDWACGLSEGREKVAVE